MGSDPADKLQQSFSGSSPESSQQLVGVALHGHQLRHSRCPKKAHGLTHVIAMAGGQGGSVAMQIFGTNRQMAERAEHREPELGKIVRINRDGSIPTDNPFVKTPGARPEIFTKGNRNVLAAALDAKGRLWEAENGPQGGDELNLIEAGKDYGWPTITYGEEYTGKPIGKAITQAPGMEQPVYYWDPVIAPSGMAIHSGKLVPEWRGNVFIGGLAAASLTRLVMKNDRVVGEERLLGERSERIRDVVEGPDGALWLLTDDKAGKLLRVAPR